MDTLETPKHFIQIGDINTACIELSKVLSSDPNNLEAWELLSKLVDDPNQRADCFNQMLRIDPENKTAAQHLQAISSKKDTPLKSEKSKTPEISSSPEELKRSIDDLRKLIEDDVLDDSNNDPTYEERIEFSDESQTGSQPSPYSSDESPVIKTKFDKDSRADLPYLGPADIVNLAGHPLPQDERLSCPYCDATISRRETRCPWCSKDLTS
jgi:hypothetical protein